MNEIAVIGQTEINRILQAAAVEKPLPLPFESRIFLASCTVCGTSLVDGFNEAAGSLSAGDRLALKRDGGNAFDELTIDVLAPSGQSLGWLPSSLNDIPARLMDAGKLLYGEVDSVKQDKEWSKVAINIFMED